MTPLRIALPALALLASIAPAQATGGFDCYVENSDLEFYANGVLGRGVVTPIMGFKAHLVLKSPQLVKAPLELYLASGLIFSWVEDGELKLHLYKEQPKDQPPPTIEFIMKTTAIDDDNIEYRGSYLLRTQALPPAGSTEAPQPLELKGEIACGWE